MNNQQQIIPIHSKNNIKLFEKGKQRKGVVFIFGSRNWAFDLLRENEFQLKSMCFSVTISLIIREELMDAR